LSEILTNPYRYAVDTSLYPDSLGSDADATTVSGVTLDTTNELLGTGCFSFDGVENYCILPTDLDTMLDGGAFSFSCWVKADASAGLKGVISKMANPTWSDPYHGFSIEQVYTVFAFGTNDGTSEIGMNLPVGDAGWKNLVVTKTADDLFSLYVNDGTPVTMTTTPNYGTQTWQIGRMHPPSGPRSWYSLIDDMVFIKGRVISASEITSLYNGGSGNLASTLDHTGIIAYYNLDNITMANDALPIS